MEYLYNGTKLPVLPNEPYQYAVMRTFRNSVLLYFSETRPYSYVLDDGITVAIRADGEVQSYTCDSSADGWDKGIVSSYLYFYETEFLWTNTDILAEDGTVAFAASDPTPVTQRNPSAMLLGFQVGQAIRRMRK